MFSAACHVPRVMQGRQIKSIKRYNQPEDVACVLWRVLSWFFGVAGSGATIVHIIPTAETDGPIWLL